MLKIRETNQFIQIQQVCAPTLLDLPWWIIIYYADRVIKQRWASVMQNLIKPWLYLEACSDPSLFLCFCWHAPKDKTAIILSFWIRFKHTTVALLGHSTYIAFCVDMYQCKTSFTCKSHYPTPTVVPITRPKPVAQRICEMWPTFATKWLNTSGTYTACVVESQKRSH